MIDPVPVTLPSNDMYRSTTPATTTRSAAGAAVTFPAHVGGRYYSGNPATEYSTLVATQDRLYAAPILLPELRTYANIAIEVTAAAGTLARLGVYSDVDGKPAALLSDCGQVDTSGTGAKGIGISLPMGPGWVWLAALFNGAPTVRALSVTGALNVLGAASSLDVVNPVGVEAGQTYGALPSSFPAADRSAGAVPRVLIAR